MKWVQEKCSAETGRLHVYDKCVRPVTECVRSGVDVGDDCGIVDKFCCLGDMLSTVGGADATVIVRIRVIGISSGI